ncbi:MAG: L,D-transpeptidase [Pseudanabaena sp.]
MLTRIKFSRMRSPNLLSADLSSPLLRVAIATNILILCSLDFGFSQTSAWANAGTDSRIKSAIKARVTVESPSQFLFIDLQNHWARKFVEGLLTNEALSAAFVTGESTGAFQPDRLITRAELANFLAIAFGNRILSKNSSQPNEPVTKAETLAAIANALNLNNKFTNKSSNSSNQNPQTYLSSMYRDSAQIPKEAMTAIASITQEGLVTNYPDPRLLSPNNPISKSELAVLLYQALVYQKRLPPIQSAYTTNPNRGLFDIELSPVTRLEVSISRRTVTAFNGEIRLKTYPVAVGREGWSSPIGEHRVLQAIAYPAWQNPFTGDVIPSKDPENPLGDRWIGFWTNGKDWSGFHGTPNRSSVGTAASHGCIRMYNEDVRELFSQVKVGTIVKVSP